MTQSNPENFAKQPRHKCSSPRGSSGLKNLAHPKKNNLEPKGGPTLKPRGGNTKRSVNTISGRWSHNPYGPFQVTAGMGEANGSSHPDFCVFTTHPVLPQRPKRNKKGWDATDGELKSKKKLDVPVSGTISSPTPATVPGEHTGKSNPPVPVVPCENWSPCVTKLTVSFPEAARTVPPIPRLQGPRV